MNRLPIRVRLTLGFAAAMAVVLAGVGAFVYQRVGNELLATVEISTEGREPFSSEGREPFSNRGREPFSSEE